MNALSTPVMMGAMGYLAGRGAGVDPLASATFAGLTTMISRAVTEIFKDMRIDERYKETIVDGVAIFAGFGITRFIFKRFSETDAGKVVALAALGITFLHNARR